MPTAMRSASSKAKGPAPYMRALRLVVWHRRREPQLRRRCLNSIVRAPTTASLNGGLRDQSATVQLD